MLHIALPGIAAFLPDGGDAGYALTGDGRLHWVEGRAADAIGDMSLIAEEGHMAWLDRPAGRLQVWSNHSRTYREATVGPGVLKLLRTSDVRRLACPGWAVDFAKEWIRGYNAPFSPYEIETDDVRGVRYVGPASRVVTDETCDLDVDDEDRLPSGRMLRETLRDVVCCPDGTALLFRIVVSAHQGRQYRLHMADDQFVLTGRLNPAYGRLAPDDPAWHPIAWRSVGSCRDSRHPLEYAKSMICSRGLLLHARSSRDATLIDWDGVLTSFPLSPGTVPLDATPERLAGRRDHVLGSTVVRGNALQLTLSGDKLALVPEPGAMVNGARFAEDDLSVWTWTPNALYRFDLD